MSTPRRLLSFLLAIVASSLLAAQDATFAIGTWNLEFLGAAPTLRRDTPPRDDDDLVAIGRKVKELGVAVLAVQEICGDEPLAKVTAAAGPSWRFVLGTTGSWNDGKTQQGVGFLYDDAVVELLAAEELLQLPSERDGVAIFHRKPVSACFRHRQSGCDFRAVTVHLKAGQKPQDEQKRAIEAAQLRAWLDALLADGGEDHDIVLLGDFNCGYGTEPQAIFERGDALRYLRQATPTSTILHFDEAIDQIVAATGFAELRRDSRRDHAVSGDAARAAFRKTYSDHFPVTVTVTATRDDDPGAKFASGGAEQCLPVTLRPASVAATPAAGASAWPPLPGTLVKLVLTNGSQLSGKLAMPVPVATGWVVLEQDGALTGVPLAQIVHLRVLLR